METKNILGIIPARFGSTRFPGKPLVEIAGKSMIRRVYEQAKKTFGTVVVATDNEEIYQEVKDFDGLASMTSETHRSGTDRCAEALQNIEKELSVNFDIVVNIQGDEPFIEPQQLQQLTACFSEKETKIATLVKKIANTEELFDPNTPKVILNKLGRAIYFSRATIPYLRNHDKNEWIKKHDYYKHIGIYAYRKDVLMHITKLPQSELELAESLEQLRWIENGIDVKVAITEFETYAIDTKEDLHEINKKIGQGVISLF